MNVFSQVAFSLQGKKISSHPLCNFPPVAILAQVAFSLQGKNFSWGMRRPVHPTHRGQTAVAGLICLGHSSSRFPVRFPWRTVIVISFSFAAGFSSCFIWLLYGF